MKAILGLVGLLMVLGAVAFLAKKQLPSESAQHAPQQPQPIPQQVKQQLESAMQQARPAEPDSK